MTTIFISYRRDDTEGQAGRLFDDLVNEFGKQSVFIDVTGIAAGRDFRRVIDQHVSSCDVLLAIIGKEWLGAKNEAGERRIDVPTDFVCLEIAAALKRDIPVIPILVQKASMPSVDQLPPELAELAYRNGLELTHARWDSDVQVLIKALRDGIQSNETLVHTKNPQIQEIPGLSGDAKGSKAPINLKHVSNVSFPRHYLPTILGTIFVVIAVIFGYEFFTNPFYRKTKDENSVAEVRVAEVKKKAADEMVVAERAAAEKKAADEMVAAERAAAEKKAEDERVTAERAVAEKKTEDERVAAERVAAEKKTEDERVAAEKVAAVKKTADEKVAAERAEKPVYRSGDSFTIETTYDNNPIKNNTTERKIEDVTSDTITWKYTNIGKEKVRKVTLTPEGNVIGAIGSFDDYFYSPPLKYFDFPLFPGKEWQQNTVKTVIKTQNKMQTQLRAKVGDWENVSVPAGTFRAIKIEINTKSTDSDGNEITGKDISWYSPEVRKTIKSILTSDTNGEKEKSVGQLINYSPAM